MLFKGSIEGTFGRRMNRFLATAILHGKEVLCFFPNPGRLTELLAPGTPVLMIPRRGVKRKTPYDMVAILHHDFWVSIDSRVPNILMRDAIEQGMIDQFRGYEKIVPEYRLGDSRFDFLLMNSGKCLLEVKSCTLVKRGTALFPDAPTTRGRRHLEELITAKYRGYRSCIAFVVQREDARCFAPNREIDEAFADALMAARAAGVEVFAFSCVLSRRGIELDGQLPVMV